VIELQNNTNMKTENIKNILLRAIRIGLALTIFVPLVFGPFGINFFEYPKAIFFKLMIEAIFALYLFLLMLDKKYLPKFSPLLIAILIFDAILTISSIFGINFYHSFFGETQRSEGIILHLHLLTFFIIIISLLKDKEDWLDLFKISVFVSATSSIAAILQQLKILSFFTVDAVRLSGTMSNPDVFACYISLSIFLAIYLFVSEKKKNLKIMWLGLTALNCYTLFFSGSRGAMLGVALGFVAIIFPKFLHSSSKKRTAILLYVLALCVLLLIVFTNITFFEKLPGGVILKRLSGSNFSFDRINPWKAAVSGFIEKPLLGWGSESFTYISDKYMTSGLVPGIYYDRAHNKILDILSCNGLMGLASYLSIFVIIFYLLFKYKKPGNSILAAFFICYFFQNIFLFDGASTYVLFFLMAGFINNNFPEKEPSETDNNLKKMRISALKILFAGLIIFFTAQIMYLLNIKPTMAAMHYVSAAKNITQDANKAFSEYKKSMGMNAIYEDDIKTAFIDKMLGSLEAGTTASFTKIIIDDLTNLKPFLYQKIKNKNGEINLSYQYLARINEQRYIYYKNSKDLDDMESAINAGISFNPGVSAYYGLMGEAKILKNDYKIGENYFLKSCDIDNCQEGEIYRRIGVAYLKKGDTKNEIKNFQRFLDIKYVHYEDKKHKYNISDDELAQLTDYVATKYCQNLNDLQNCVKVYEKGINTLPKYAKVLNQRLIMNKEAIKAK
jgi:O-antigen ligase